MSLKHWPKILGLSAWNLLNMLLYAVFWLAIITLVSSIFLNQPFDWRRVFFLDEGGEGHLIFVLLFVIPTAFAGIVAVRRSRILDAEDQE